MHAITGGCNCTLLLPQLKFTVKVSAENYATSMVVVQLRFAHDFGGVAYPVQPRDNEQREPRGFSQHDASRCRRTYGGKSTPNESCAPFTVSGFDSRDFHDCESPRPWSRPGQLRQDRSRPAPGRVGPGSQGRHLYTTTQHEHCKNGPGKKKAKVCSCQPGVRHWPRADCHSTRVHRGRTTAKEDVY